MSSQRTSFPTSDPDMDGHQVGDEHEGMVHAPTEPPGNNGTRHMGISPFWRDRLIELSMIASMALYYVTGNWHFGAQAFFHLNPLYSLPFLLLFAVLSWYRLPFAVALLPLTLPFYLLQKPVVGQNTPGLEFSLAEITFGVCLVVALAQLLLKRSRWQFALSWRELRERSGPFAIPILVFVLAAAFSVVIAYDHKVALRDLREEIVEPLLYVLLALFCLRNRQDVYRLMGTLLAAGFIIAVLGIVQYAFFKNTLVLEDGIRRISAVYGSANSIGLLYDYVLPIGLAWAFLKSRRHLSIFNAWIDRIAALVFCAVLLYVLYLTKSNGAEIAIALAAVFMIVLSIRNRKVLLIGGAIAVIVLGIAGYVFRHSIASAVLYGHMSGNGVSTLTIRYSLWQVALNMIHDSPWYGFGLDNWLCHYSVNSVCYTPHLYHYDLARNVFTGAPLVNLRYQAYLSHPHDVLLQIWVSMGVFGVLAFVAVLALFFRLFGRVLVQARLHEEYRQWRWVIIGAGAAMLAAMVQGLVDSAFLEQDLSYCFWILVALLLLIRVFTHTPWRGRLRPRGSVANSGSAIPSADVASDENVS